MVSKRVTLVTVGRGCEWTGSPLLVPSQDYLLHSTNKMVREKN